MIEENGRVVAVEAGAVWVETVKQSGCASCSARAGCGHHVLDSAQSGARARVRALTAGDDYRVDDRVVVGIPEGMLLRGAVMVYLVPLTLLFAGALLGSRLVYGDMDLSAPLGLAGLAAGFLVNRRHSRRHRNDESHHPRVIRRLHETPPTSSRILCE